MRSVLPAHLLSGVCTAIQPDGQEAMLGTLTGCEGRARLSLADQQMVVHSALPEKLNLP